MHKYANEVQKFQTTTEKQQSQPQNKKSVTTIFESDGGRETIFKSYRTFSTIFLYNE